VAWRASWLKPRRESGRRGGLGPEHRCHRGCAAPPWQGLIGRSANRIPSALGMAMASEAATSCCWPTPSAGAAPPRQVARSPRSCPDLLPSSTRAGRVRCLPSAPRPRRMPAAASQHQRCEL